MRFLALVNGHSLAHVSRPLEVAKALARRGHSTVFAGGGVYLEVPAKAGFRTEQLSYIPNARLMELTRSNKMSGLFEKAEVESFIDADLELIDEVEPDCLIADNRISACTSAEIAGVPSVGIVNAHMTRFKKLPFYTPNHYLWSWMHPLFSFTDRLGTAFENHLWDRVVMTPLKEAREGRGLPCLSGYEHECGDMTLLPDVALFNPLRRIPENMRYVGPLTWRSELPPPECLEKLDRSRPCIYLTIGSQGLIELYQMTEDLAREGYTVVIATGDSGVPEGVVLPEHVYAERYVNADLLLPHCDAVICHGGNGTLYQVLRHGVPIVGISMHEEQHYGLKRLTQLGLGVGFRWKNVQKRGSSLLSEAVKKVSSSPRARARCRELQQQLSRVDGPEIAADAIETFVRSKRFVKGQRFLVDRVDESEARPLVA